MEHELDVGHLHDVIEGRVWGRSSGRTTAACMNIAGVLSVAKRPVTILYPIPRRDWMRHICVMLRGVLEAWGMEVVVMARWNEVRVGEHRVIFVLPDHPYRLRGLEAAYVVEDLGEAGDYIDRAEWELLAREINVSLSRNRYETSGQTEAPGTAV